MNDIDFKNEDLSKLNENLSKVIENIMFDGQGFKLLNIKLDNLKTENLGIFKELKNSEVYDLQLKKETL